MVKIEFATGNTAFTDDRETEIARILRYLADGIDEGAIANGYPIEDINENCVGTLTITDD